MILDIGSVWHRYSVRGAKIPAPGQPSNVVLVKRNLTDLPTLGSVVLLVQLLRSLLEVETHWKCCSRRNRRKVAHCFDRSCSRRAQLAPIMRRRNGAKAKGVHR